MKAFTLTSTLLAALSLSVMGQSDAEIRSQISLKEKQLNAIKTELSALRSKLSAPLGRNYIVKTGDTVSSIARKHQVSASDIMTWNKITDPTKLGIGETLVVSAGAVKKSTPSAPTTKYKVEKGDTFYSIARRHKMTVTQLRALNPDVSTHLISLGQTLAVSGKPVVTVKKQTEKPVTIAETVKKTEAPRSASKKASTATNLAKKPADPAPKKESVASVKKEEKKPVSTPPSPPVIEEPKSTTGSTVASVILTDETTFDAFASKHGTNTDQLNALNGWSLPKATVLARGSEIYVPK
jgi:LysM repeat protein